MYRYADMCPGDEPNNYNESSWLLTHPGDIVFIHHNAISLTHDITNIILGLQAIWFCGSVTIMTVMISGQIIYIYFHRNAWYSIAKGYF